MQDRKRKKIVFSSKVPLGKGSAAMGFQVGFKGVGFFFVFKGYCVFDPPRSEFRCMRHIAFIVFFKTGFQIFGTANVKMSSSCFIQEYVNIIEVIQGVLLKIGVIGKACRDEDWWAVRDSNT